MEVVSDLPPNVLVSLDPSFDNLNFDTDEVFSDLDDFPVADGEVDGNLIDAADLNSDFDGDNDILFTDSGEDSIDVFQAFEHNPIDADEDDILLTGGNNSLVEDSETDNNLITGGLDGDRFWLATDQTNLSATSNIITDFSSAEEDTISLINTSLDFF